MKRFFLIPPAFPLCAAGVLFLSISELGFSDDWPIFRGPQKNGISTETGWKVPSGEAPVAWKASVGLGFSAATVADGKVIITGHDGKKTDTVYCFEESTGKRLWVHSYPQPLGNLYYDGGTTGTVTADGGRLYHIAREGELFCLNSSDGSVVWQTHLQKDHGYSKPTWGFTGAVLPHGDRLFVTAGESGLCLNKSDGSVIWKSKDEEAGYATPYLFQRDGRELLIFTNKRFYNCVEAETGKKLWEVKWMTRYGVNASDPIVSGDRIFIATGYGKGANLLQWDGKGEPVSLWRSRDMRNQMNASVLVDGYLYGIDGDQNGDGTSLKCMELESGKTMWSNPEVGHGTVCVADGKLIVLTEKGELQIAPVSPDGYGYVFRQQVVPGRVWTVPVLANGRVYCRNEKGEVTVVDLRKG